MLDFGIGHRATFAMRGHRRSGFSRLSMDGEFDLAAVPSFERNLASVELAGRALILDLAGVTFADSSGMHALSRAAERAEAHGWRVEIVNCRPRVERMFGLTGNERLLHDETVSELIGAATADGWARFSLPEEGS